MELGVGPESAACWEVDISQVRALIEAAAAGDEWPDWVAALLHGAYIVDVNERGLELVGSPVARELMVGQPVAGFCPPESWTTLAELIVAVATDAPDHGVRRSGINSFMFQNAVLSVWGAPGGAAQDTVWVAVDGEMAEDRSFWAVRASEQRYRRLLHHLPGALLQVDARAMGAIFYQLRSEGVTDLTPYLSTDGELIDAARNLVRVTDANLGAMQLFGAASVDELIGKIDYVFGADPEVARRVVIAHFEGRRNLVEIMKLRTFDGRLRDVQLSVTYPTPPERLDVSLMSLEDITDRLRTEAQLRQLQADYSRAARISMLGELATSIAHEVNQPLSAVVTNAETSLRWLSRDEPNLAKVAQLTARIAESARRASDIVQRIRGMAARRAPEQAPLDLNEIVNEARVFVSHELESRSIAVTLDLDLHLPKIVGDRVQLQQVVVNLILNAAQALGRSGADGRIALCTTKTIDGAVGFGVDDNGPGIAAADLDRIFESFFTTKEEGVGIGLAICQSIIAAHGGTIEARNHPDGGAGFRFTVPAANA